MAAAPDLIPVEDISSQEGQAEEVVFRADLIPVVGSSLFIGDLLMRGLTPDGKDIFGLPYSLGASAPRSIAIGAVAAGVVWAMERFGNNNPVVTDPYKRSE